MNSLELELARISLNKFHLLTEKKRSQVSFSNIAALQNTLNFKKEALRKAKDFKKCFREKQIDCNEIH